MVQILSFVPILQMPMVDSVFLLLEKDNMLLWQASIVYLSIYLLQVLQYLLIISSYDVLIVIAPSDQDEAWEKPPFQLPG